MKATLLVLLVLAGAVRPAAGINVPQTRQQFMDAVAAGAGATDMETLVVERDIDEVYGLLEERASTCLDVLVERTAFVGYTEHSSSDYNPTLERTGSGTAAFALQVVHRPRGVGHTPPPGGLYMMAADLKSLGKGRTQVVVYYPSMGFKKIVGAFKQWAGGNRADCPKMR